MDQVLADRYRIERKLGEGGMAEVFLVHDALGDRPLALKLLKPEEVNSRDYFMHEFRVLARLEHPNLIRVHDFGTAAGEDGDRFYYTCEFLQGADLFSATKDLDFEGLYDVVRQVLEALSYIHDRGLVHYDVKPENVNVRTIPATRPGMRPRYKVKLVDFGLTGKATTQRGEKIKGTVHYVAPEVAKSLPADRRADLYSLGITLYYVATRKLPYDGGSAFSIIRKHIEKIPAPPTSLRADVPEAWATFIMRLIEKDPARRYASAPEAIEDLSRRLGKVYEPFIPPVSAEMPALPAAPGMGPTVGVPLSARFMGRKAELDQLVDALPRDGDCAPRVFWIEGEEGIGKTRLVRELKVQAQLLGVPFLDAVCVKEGERPFERIARLALTLSDVKPLADELSGPLEALFPGILGSRDEGRTDSGRLKQSPALRGDPEELRLILDRVAEFLLQASIRRPYLLVLEDVRRANEITVALLGMLLRALAVGASGKADGEGGRRSPRFVVVLTDRPGGESGEVTALAEGIPEDIAGEIVEDLSEIRAQLSASGVLVSMPLNRLGPEQTSGMVASMLALSEPHPELCEKVHQVTGGNPFFVEELVRSLMDDGVLALRKETLSSEELDRIKPPRSLGELIGQRLAKMPEDTRAVLVALAVLVAPSPLRLLARTSKRSAEASLDALDLLVRRRLVQRLDDESGGPPRYRLTHAQVQRSVIKSVSRRALEATHRRALSALEHEFPEGSRAGVLERLARHAHQCGDLASALRYATQAGVRAQDEGNPQQAIELLDRALELLRWEDVVAPEDRPPQERLVLTRLSEVLSTVGRYKDAERALEELLSVSGDADDPGSATWARRRLGDLAIRQGNSAEARRWLRDALTRVGDTADPALRAERARILEVMSRIALWRGDYLQVIALAGEAVEIFRALNRRQDSLWALNILCTTEYYRSQAERAGDLLRECLELTRGEETSYIALLARLGLSDEQQREFDRQLRSFEGSTSGSLRRKAGDAFGLVLSFSVIGTYFDLRADILDTVAFYEASLEAYERLGDANKTALTHNNLGVYRRHLGQFGQALLDFETSLAIHERSSDRQGGSVALMNLALLLLEMGDAEGALIRARRALAIAREVGITWLTGHSHRVIGRVLTLQGSLREADRELQRAAGVFRMIGNLRSLGDLLLDRAEVACTAGQGPEAAEFLEKAKSTGEEEKASDFLCRQRLVQGRISLMESEPSRAVDSFEGALEIANRSQLCELRLAAHRELARACTKLGTLRLAQQHLDESHAIVAQLTHGLEPRLREMFEFSPGSVRARETSRLLVERSLED